MRDDEARALVRRWWDGIWREGDLSIVDDLCTDPYTRHTGMGTERLSHQEYKAKLVQTQRVLRGAVTTIDDEVVVGDKVWSRATSRGIRTARMGAQLRRLRRIWDGHGSERQVSAT